MPEAFGQQALELRKRRLVDRSQSRATTFVEPHPPHLLEQFVRHLGDAEQLGRIGLKVFFLLLDRSRRRRYDRHIRRHNSLAHHRARPWGNPPPPWLMAGHEPGARTSGSVGRGVNSPFFRVRQCLRGISRSPSVCRTTAPSSIQPQAHDATKRRRVIEANGPRCPGLTRRRGTPGRTKSRDVRSRGPRKVACLLASSEHSSTIRSCWIPKGVVSRGGAPPMHLARSISPIR